MYWRDQNVPLVIRTNTSDMSANLVLSIILNSMNQWNLSSSAKVNSVSSSNNEIKFVRNFPYGSAVLGVTEVSYNSYGAIQKAVILLNDDYQFRTSPGVYFGMEAFLGDVVTHELGHLLGLSHSEVLDSTMFYSSFSGQSQVSFDDKTGIRQKYDGNFGKISGVIKGGNDIGILGTHVQAISRRTGKATGIVSVENGEFIIGGLDLEDTYYLYTAPIKNVSSLPGYFANVQNNFCPASYLGSFFSKCGRDYEGKPQGISLTHNQPQIDVGIVTVNCNFKADISYNAQKLSGNFSPMTLFTYDLNYPDKVDHSFVGWFRNPSNTEWSNADRFLLDFSALNLSGLFLKVSLISYPFGSQLSYKINIKNEIQDLVTDATSLVYSPVTKTYDTDFHTFIPISSINSHNHFEISVQSKKLLTPSLVFPSYENFSSSTHLPYLLMTSLWQNNGGELVPIVSTESNLSDNSSCLDAPFTYGVSKALEVEGDASLGSYQGAVAGCGSIEGPGNGSGPGSWPLLGLGFILAYIAPTIVKSRKKFLS